MSKHITPSMVERTIYLVDQSRALDIICPEPPRDQRGRRGRVRENTRLWMIGAILCTRLGHPTTLTNIHAVLTEALPRKTQWELGVRRTLTTKNGKFAQQTEAPASLTQRGKPRKQFAPGYEVVSYDDLTNAVRRLNSRLAYGPSAVKLGATERAARQGIVQDAVSALVTVSHVNRKCATVAIDATGQWAWAIGSAKARRAAVNAKDTAKSGDTNDDADHTLEVTDAAWGYKTGKGGNKEVGFGFHQHTLVRVADPGMPANSEPLLVEALAVVPANEDVVETTLRLIDEVHLRAALKRVIGDLLYTNLRAERWAVPLAKQGIEQVIAMRSDNASTVDINGAIMQFGWMHCPAAPMAERPLPATFARDEAPGHFEAVEEFKRLWAFDRKESGLGPVASTKWICPALSGRVSCSARDKLFQNAADDLGLPKVQPPADWQSRKCCTQKTMGFTPDPANPLHQRKLMQREYYGDERWRKAFNRRTYVEGAFGILKNPSRQGMRRGQNLVAGLVVANVLAALKVALFNEEQLRAWHEETGKGPAGHPLLQPDLPYYGFSDLTQDEADAIDAQCLAAIEEQEEAA